MAASEEDAATMRAAIVQMALDGDTKGASGVTAIYEAVTSDNKNSKGSGGNNKSGKGRTK